MPNKNTLSERKTESTAQYLTALCTTESFNSLKDPSSYIYIYIYIYVCIHTHTHTHINDVCVCVYSSLHI